MDDTGREFTESCHEDEEIEKKKNIDVKNIDFFFFCEGNGKENVSLFICLFEKERFKSTLLSHVYCLNPVPSFTTYFPENIKRMLVFNNFEKISL